MVVVPVYTGNSVKALYLSCSYAPLKAFLLHSSPNHLGLDSAATILDAAIVSLIFIILSSAFSLKVTDFLSFTLFFWRSPLTVLYALRKSSLVISFWIAFSVSSAPRFLSLLAILSSKTKESTPIWAFSSGATSTPLSFWTKT